MSLGFTHFKGADKKVKGNEREGRQEKARTGEGGKKEVERKEEGEEEKERKEPILMTMRNQNHQQFPTLLTEVGLQVVRSMGHQSFYFLFNTLYF